LRALVELRTLNYLRAIIDLRAIFDSRTINDLRAIIRFAGYYRVYKKITYAVTRSQKSTSRVWGQAGLQPCRLGIIVDVINNHPPVSIDVPGPLGFGINHIRGAKIPLGSNPVGNIVGVGTLGGSSIILIVESLFLVLVQVLDKVIGRLIGDVGVLLVEQVVLGDGQLDVVLGIVGVFKAVVKASCIGTVGGQFGVTVALLGVGPVGATMRVGDGMVEFMVGVMVGGGMGGVGSGRRMVIGCGGRAIRGGGRGVRSVIGGGSGVMIG
jgi:hypothetical protein